MVESAPATVSSMTLSLGEGIAVVQRWRDGTVTLAFASLHGEVTGSEETIAEKLRALLRFVEGR